MNHFTFPFFALVLVSLLSSCQPPKPLSLPGGPVDPGLNKSTVNQKNVDQKAVEAKRLEIENAAKRRAAAADKLRESKEREASASTTEKIYPKQEALKPVKQVRNWPFATPVPGNEGFVYSPYSSKVIDVRTIASGTLVRDPDEPASSRNFFRVP